MFPTRGQTVYVEGDVTDVKVISQQFGLRQSRTGGVKVETERVSVECLRHVSVVHCYGHGGGG